MNNASRSAPRALVEGMTEEEAAPRLADLYAQSAGRPPIFDEDDIEQAIEDAADRIIGRRGGRDLA